jgi:hypothetical protein
LNSKVTVFRDFFPDVGPELAMPFNRERRERNQEAECIVVCMQKK